MTRLLLISALALGLLSAAPAVAAPPDNAAVGQWAAQAMADIMTFGFSDYDERKEENRKYFTATGHTQFYESIDKAQIREMVIRNKQVTALKVTCGPAAGGPEIEGGFKTWTLRMPVVLTYQHANLARDDRLEMTITVREDKDAANPEKLGIERVIMAPVPEGGDAGSCSEADHIRGEIASLTGGERVVLDNAIARREEKIRVIEDRQKEEPPEAQRAAPAPENAAIGKWAAQAITDIMTFSYSDYDKRKEENRKYFTAAGYRMFYDAMDKSRIPETVVRNKLVTALKATCAPAAEGPVPRDGVDEWILKMPSLMVYLGGGKPREDMLMLTIVVRKDKDAANPEKLGIQQYIAVPMDEGEDAAICSDADRRRGAIASLTAERDGLVSQRNGLDEKIRALDNKLKEKQAP